MHDMSKNWLLYHFLLFW